MIPRRTTEQFIECAIKNQYCEDNTIRLLRIPYWDIDTIPEILAQGGVVCR